MTNQQNRERTKIFYLLLRLHQGHIFGPQKKLSIFYKKNIQKMIQIGILSGKMREIGNLEISTEKMVKKLVI